jgi:hypothetical protein
VSILEDVYYALRYDIVSILEDVYYAFRYDIVSILEDVNYDVCCKKDQYNFIDSSSQVSMFSSTLRGPVFFH